jgi:hypothetical protein
MRQKNRVTVTILRRNNLVKKGRNRRKNLVRRGRNRRNQSNDQMIKSFGERKVGLVRN